MFAAVVPPGYIPPPPGPGKVERRGSLSRTHSELSGYVAELRKSGGRFKGLKSFGVLQDGDTESLFERESRKRTYYAETWKLLEQLSGLFESEFLGEAVRELITLNLDRIKWWFEKYGDNKDCETFMGYHVVKTKIREIENFVTHCLTEEVLPGDINNALQNLQVAMNENYRGFILEIPDYELRHLFN